MNVNKINKRQSFSRLGGMGLPVSNNFMSKMGVDGKFIPFSGDGFSVPTSNTYPQALSTLYANSSTHGAALNRKGMLTFGQGIDFDVLPETLVTWLLNINLDNESINDILNKVSYDLVTFGGFSLKVQWRGDRTIESVYHVPFKNVRLGMPNDDHEITYYIISNNWESKLHRSLERNERINTFDPELINKPTIVDNKPVFDEDTLDNGTQLIYYKTYSTAGDGFYPLPDYVQVIDSALNEVSTGIAMNNVITNGVNGATIISHSDDTILDDESKQNVTDQFNTFVSGPENSGGIMYLPANIKVDTLQGLDAGTYTEVNSEMRQRIITGHGIPAILLEYSQGGGFNNRSEEMTTALLQFQQSSIKRYQQQIIRVLNGILDYVTTDEFDLQIIPFITEEVDKVSTDEDITDETKDSITVEDSTSLTN